MDAGHGVRREPVMRNRFVLVGPKSDPANVHAATSASDALQRISREKQVFVSRGDESGTHCRELRLWNELGKREWPNYLETGQGMGRTLVISDQKQGYTLCDAATFRKLQSRISLVALLNNGQGLENRYSAIAVAPEKNRLINGKAAERFLDYLIRPATQQRIADFRIEGRRLFEPLRLVGLIGDRVPEDNR